MKVFSQQRGCRQAELRLDHDQQENRQNPLCGALIQRAGHKLDFSLPSDIRLNQAM